MTKKYDITIDRDDMLTIWDALYGRRAAEVRGNSNDDLSKEKIAKYNRLMKLFDTDIVDNNLTFSTRYGSGQTPLKAGE